MNLISKNEESGEQENEALEADGGAAEAETAEVAMKQSQEQELKIEKKITIELDPEITVKEADENAPPTVIKVPVETVAEKPAGAEDPDESRWPQMHPEEKRVYLVNLSEKLATDMVDEVMQRLNMCTCSMCKNDVLALALNSLTHNYVTTDAGKQYMLLEVYKKQYETDVLAALTKACVRVKAAPKH